MAYDIIGEVAIVPTDKKVKKLKPLALKLLKHKNIKSVYARGKISGRLRIPRLTWIAGKKISEALHHESGCLMKLDIKKCYFSPRLQQDRLEIARQVKPNETVLVMFSGVAPYALVIAKHSKAKVIYCIELSRTAFKYAEENVKLNKLSNVKIIQGDVKKVIPTLAKKIKFDRIVMARPQLQESFLHEAFMVSEKNTVMHFYDFLSKEEFPFEAIKKINEAVKKSRFCCLLLNYKKVREIAPYKYHIRIDFKIV